MPSYHSTFLAEEDGLRSVSSMALLPLRTNTRGPAILTQSYDIADETLDLFRANTFFRNFEIRGTSDRTLIYGILYITQCLCALNANMPKQEAVRVLTNLSLDNFSVPGDAGFPLNGIYSSPSDKQEQVTLRGYLQQFRQELAARLIERIYLQDPNHPSKFWLAFSKKKFMNKSL